MTVEKRRCSVFSRNSEKLDESCSEGKEILKDRYILRDKLRKHLRQRVEARGPGASPAPRQRCLD